MTSKCRWTLCRGGESSFSATTSRIDHLHFPRSHFFQLPIAALSNPLLPTPLPLLETRELCDAGILLAHLPHLPLTHLPTLSATRLSFSLALVQMSLFGGAAAPAAPAGTSNTTGDISKDIPINQPPEDSISDLRFSPTSDHLAVASWDNKVRIYEIGMNGQSEGKAMLNMDGPVMNCCWSPVSFILLSLAHSISMKFLVYLLEANISFFF